MKLERIIIENFRQYFGRQKLTFSKDSKRNVTVIHGVNGAGKTSLFLAINWCLYGEGVSNVGELISKEAISGANPGETVHSSVEISFTHNGERYLVSRRLSGIKRLDGTISLQIGDDFTLMKTQLDGTTVKVNNPVGTINAILPSNVRTYFLFDGEKIDNFAKPESSDEVKYAIFNVLKLEVLTRARRHLEEVADEYRRELKRISSGELRELVEQLEQLHNKKEKELKRLDEVAHEIESARNKIKDIDQRLLELQNARAFQQQRERLERDIQQIRTELNELIEEIRSIVTSGYIINAKPAIITALSILEEKRERGEIPSNIRQQFIQDLIDRQVCICGRHFEIGSDEHKHLIALMNRSFPGSLEDDVLNTSAILKSLSEQSETYKNQLNKFMQKRVALLDRLKALEEELDDVSRQLKGSPQEEISSLENKRRDFLADIDSYHIELGNLKSIIINITKEIKELETKIEKAKKRENKERRLTRKAALAQQAADAIDKMYQAFADDMRKRIEAKTKEIFKQLVWKDSHFQDIRLGSDYKLEVIDRWGLPARPELSAGERQVLSLSFIIAMSRISEEEAPLVMDTPFGRLSSQHRNSITEHIPELADQLVLFVTDEELRDQARLNLEPRIGAEYRLNFNKNTSCTTIEEVA